MNIQLENVEIYNIDDLKAVVAQNQETHRQIAQKAEILLEEELEVFVQWLQSLETAPTITCLRNKVENIRKQELEKALSRLGTEFSQKHQEVLEILTRSIINKILHEPLMQLQTQPDLESQYLALQAVKMLFNLDSYAASFSLKSQFNTGLKR